MRFIFGPLGFSDTNMLVSATRIARNNHDPKHMSIHFPSVGKIHTELTDFNHCMQTKDDYIAGPVTQFCVEGTGHFEKNVEIVIPHCIRRANMHTVRVLCGSGKVFRVISNHSHLLTYSN